MSTSITLSDEPCGSIIFSIKLVGKVVYQPIPTMIPHKSSFMVYLYHKHLSHQGHCNRSQNDNTMTSSAPWFSLSLEWHQGIIVGTNILGRSIFRGRSQSLCINFNKNRYFNSLKFERVEAQTKVLIIPRNTWSLIILVFLHCLQRRCYRLNHIQILINSL